MVILNSLVSPPMYVLIPSAYAHIFISGDDASSFLTLLERLRVEAILANNTMYSNLTTAQDHILQMLDRIDDITDIENDFTISSLQFDNSTVKGLLLANLIDEALVHYGGAYGIMPQIMIDMSYMTRSEAILDKNISMVNINKYQTSQEYANRAIELFNIMLESSRIENNTNSRELAEGLTSLREAIDNKNTPMKVMMIVHMQIHPNLQETYNLKLE